MANVVSFGEEVEGYEIPVLNEREIRAAAGLLFVVMFISILMAIAKGDFLLLKYAVTIFLADIALRVFVSPRFSPSLILGRLIVRNQVPEYVGARQKRFAWMIGVALATTMFILVVLLNTYSPISGITCLVCLVFLFFETAFGICLGCKLYSMVSKEKAQHCPGEVCDPRSRQDIQRTSRAQLLVVLGFLAFIVLTVLLFGEKFREKPHALFGNAASSQSR
jgi:hypothetical protein